MAPDIRLHIGILIGKIRSFQGAIDQPKIFAVAKGLCTTDFAIDEREPFGEPAQIFALYLAVLHRNIFGVPESVLGIQDGIADGQIFHVLEGILALELPVPDGHIPAAHEHILALQTAAGHGYIRAVPAELRGLDAAVLQHDVAAFPQGLHAAQLAIPDDAVLCVPQGSAGGFRALADYTDKQDSVSSISVQLSAKPDAVADAVARLKEENFKQKARMIALQQQLLQLQIAAIPSEQENVVLFFEDLDTPAMREAVNTLCETHKGYCSVFKGSDESGYQYILGSAHRNCKDAGAILTESFSARGGGSERMIQGSLQASKEDVMKCILEI